MLRRLTLTLMTLLGAAACGGGGGGGGAAGAPPGGDSGSGDLPGQADVGPGAGTPISATAFHPVEIAFATRVLSSVHGGPLHEADPSPANPWLDYRLDVQFVPPDGSPAWHVAGFFAGDGLGGPTGDVWICRFAPPDIPGSWTVTGILRHAPRVNVLAPDDPSGQFLYRRDLVLDVAPRDPSAPGFLARGVPRYVGERYLYCDDGGIFLKAGVNSPENLLGYSGFHGAVDGSDGGPPGQTGGAPDFLHEFDAHIVDWQPGDPDWGGGAGRGLIGALNWLAGAGVNAIYVLPMNLGGDGRDTFPFVTNGGGGVSPNDQLHALHWSVRRMHEWELVLAHASRLGLYVQFVLAERESGNIEWLGAADSDERRLFLKNLVAHFAHHPAVEWTLCEENREPGTFGFAQFDAVELADMANWIRAWDAYHHPRSVHTDPNDLGLYAHLIDEGLADWVEVLALQIHGENGNAGYYYSLLTQAAHDLFETHAGRSIVVDVDEPGHWQEGAASELHPSAWASRPWAGPVDRRRRVLWDVLLSGGGIAWYFGNWDEHQGGGDLTLEDFRTRASLLEVTRIAADLMKRFPLSEMRAHDEVFDGQCAASGCHGTPGVTSDCHCEFGRPEVLAQIDGPVVVYYPTLLDGVGPSTGALDLTHVTTTPGIYQSYWVDPRTGLELGPIVTYDSAAPIVPLLPDSFVAGGLQRLDDFVLVLERVQ